MPLGTLCRGLRHASTSLHRCRWGPYLGFWGGGGVPSRHLVDVAVAGVELHDVAAGTAHDP